MRFLPKSLSQAPAQPVSEETPSEPGQDPFRGRFEAISRSQAIIEFKLDGTIVTANDNFLAAVGYTLEEIQGHHHRIFCDPEYTATPEYRDFWAKLGRGEFDSGEYRRVRKDGSDIWIQASYNPIFDASGTLTGVIKSAADITDQKLRAAED